MASNYVIESIKLCLDGGHGNVMSSFGGRTTSGFDVIEGGSRRPSPVARFKKRPGMIELTVECSMAYRDKTAYLTVIYFKKNRENMRRKLV